MQNRCTIIDNKNIRIARNLRFYMAVRARKELSVDAEPKARTSFAHLLKLHRFCIIAQAKVHQSMELPADALYVVHDKLCIDWLGRLASVCRLSSSQAIATMTRRLKRPRQLKQHELRRVVEEWKIDSGKLRRRRALLQPQLRNSVHAMLDAPWESKLCRKISAEWITGLGLGGDDSLRQLGALLDTMRSGLIPRVPTWIEGALIQYPRPQWQPHLLSFHWGLWTVSIGSGVPSVEDGCIELAVHNSISGTVLVATAESNGWVAMRPPDSSNHGDLVYYGHWAAGFAVEEERRPSDEPVLSADVQATLFAQLGAAQPLPHTPENLHISWQQETIPDDQTWWHVIPAQDQDVLYIVCCSVMHTVACEVMAIHKQHNRVRCHHLRLGDGDFHRELGEVEWPTESSDCAAAPSAQTNSCFSDTQSYSS